jgi:hypothetical protein
MTPAFRATTSRVLADAGRHIGGRVAPSSWTGRAYTRPVDGSSASEDWRGVDVVQIRQQLRLPVKERVRTMVEAANAMLAIQTHAADARKTRGG